MIAYKILQEHGLRRYDDLVVSDQSSSLLRNYILAEFNGVQSVVLTKEKVKTKNVRHQKGDFKRDKSGNPITRPDGQGYETYAAGEIEVVEETISTPFFDTSVDTGAEKKLLEYLRKVVVMPDYKSLREKCDVGTDYEKACALIEKIAQCYELDDTQKFVERFALFASNVKAKALGRQPRWPVLFSLVGGMGIGKSWLSEKIARTSDEVFGTKSAPTTYDSLTGRFNSQMMTRGILRLEEAVGLEKSKVETMKSYITSTTVEIERKGLDREIAPNLVSFLSTTNEPVMNILSGADQNRRVVEFVVKGKRQEMDERQLEDLLVKMWYAIPCRVPNEDLIYKQLIDETSNLLDSTMEDVVYDLFKENELLLVKGQRLMKHQFKTLCAQKRMPSAKVEMWCEGEGLIRKDKGGNVLVYKKALKDFYRRMENDYSSGNAASTTPTSPTSDIDKMIEEVLA